MSLPLFRTAGLAGLAFLFALCAPLARADDGEPHGIPQDWSHRHLIFSNPDTPQEAAAKGTYQQWLRDFEDPRFASAVIRKMDAQELSRAPRAVQKSGN